MKIQTSYRYKYWVLSVPDGEQLYVFNDIDENIAIVQEWATQNNHKIARYLDDPEATCRIVVTTDKFTELVD
jgi:hypothetical protein